MLKLAWLGPPVAELDGVQIHFETRKIAALLAYLSLNPRGCAREKLAVLFWPEFDQTHAMANLRRALGSLTRVLPSDCFETNRESVRWSEVASVELDVLKFQELIQAVRAHAHESGQGDSTQGVCSCQSCLNRLETACEVYRGDFLDGLNLPDAPAFDEWQYLTRAELNRALAWVLEHLAGGLVRQAQAGQLMPRQPAWEKAASVARRWLSLDRLEAGPHLALVQIYAQAGQRSLAQRQVEDYTRVFTEEFGEAPDAETRECFQQALNLGQLNRVVSKSPAGGASAAAPVLLKTKLYLPQVKSSRVSRPRLLSKLNEIGEHKLTLISAPAGFGKTSLLAEWAAQTDLLVGWFSLDGSDNDPHQFLSYLCAAFESLQEGVADSAVSMLESAQPVPPKTILTMLLKGLEQAAEPLVIVLDDYQFISGQPVHEAVAYTLERSTANLHMVIASRADPPLPLARLRADGELLDVRTDDLRFNLEECEAFFSHVMGLDITTEGIQALAARTEGWAVGLQMAGISLQGTTNQAQFIQTFSGSHRYILEYLLQEVLDQQPEQVRSFLFKTSILDRLCCGLCDALCSEEINKHTINSASILEYLERANLFLVPLDDERIWYRYHHLFADLLRARLHQAQPDLIPQLHRQAAAWLEQKGLIAEAIQHLLAAQEIGQAADLIEHYGCAHWEKGDPSVIQMAVNLPPEMLITRPKIGICHAWIHIIHSEIPQALPLLYGMQRHLAEAGSDSGLRWIQTIIQTALAFLSPEGSSVKQPLPDDRLLDEIPADHLILRDAAEILYGMALGRRGGIDRTVQLSLKWIQRRQSPLPRATIPTLVPFLSRLYLMQGRLNAAASLCQEYLDPKGEEGFLQVYTTGSMYIDFGEVLYEKNCLQEAERYIRAGLQANQPWGNIMTDGHGLSALARLLLAKGDYAGAFQTLETFEARWQGISRPREFDEDFLTLRARLQLASGDLDSAARWADQVQQSEDFHLWENYYRRPLAGICLAQGRYIQAEELLVEHTPKIGDGNFIVYQLEIHMLLALALAGQNKLAEALERVETALALAEPEGYLRIFLDFGEPARDLLAAYVRSATPGCTSYAQKILAAFPPPGQSAALSH